MSDDVECYKEVFRCFNLLFRIFRKIEFNWWEVLVGSLSIYNIILFFVKIYLVFVVLKNEVILCCLLSFLVLVLSFFFLSEVNFFFLFWDVFFLFEEFVFIVVLLLLIYIGNLIVFWVGLVIFIILLVIVFVVGVILVFIDLFCFLKIGCFL